MDTVFLSCSTSLWDHSRSERATSPYQIVFQFVPTKMDYLLVKGLFEKADENGLTQVIISESHSILDRTTFIQFFQSITKSTASPALAY